MDYTEIVNLISNIGFPIAITVYMMVHNTKIVKENTDALNSLKSVINALVMKSGD